MQIQKKRANFQDFQVCIKMQIMQRAYSPLNTPPRDPFVAVHLGPGGWSNFFLQLMSRDIGARSPALLATGRKGVVPPVGRLTGGGHRGRGRLPGRRAGTRARGGGHPLPVPRLPSVALWPLVCLWPGANFASGPVCCVVGWGCPLPPGVPRQHSHSPASPAGPASLGGRAPGPGTAGPACPAGGWPPGRRWGCRTLWAAGVGSGGALPSTLDTLHPPEPGPGEAQAAGNPSARQKLGW